METGDRQVTLKLGKLQALAALTRQPGALTAEDRSAAYERSLNHGEEEQRRVEEAPRALPERHGMDLRRQLDHSKQENRRPEPALVEAQHIVDATLPARPIAPHADPANHVQP